MSKHYQPEVLRSSWRSSEQCNHPKESEDYHAMIRLLKVISMDKAWNSHQTDDRSRNREHDHELPSHSRREAGNWRYNCLDCRDVSDSIIRPQSYLRHIAQVRLARAPRILLSVQSSMDQFNDGSSYQLPCTPSASTSSYPRVVARTTSLFGATSSCPIYIYIIQLIRCRNDTQSA